MFNKNIIGFFILKGHTPAPNNINYVFSHEIHLISNIQKKVLENYLKKTENRVIYTSDSMNNRLTKGKEYVVKSIMREDNGTTYFSGLENDAGMSETYSVDFFSVKLLELDFTATSYMLLSEKCLIEPNGTIRK
jgi:hypothetical protein